LTPENEAHGARNPRLSGTEGFFESIRGGLIVSCQARVGEPLYGSDFMAEMAKAAQLGGACGIRANGEEDVAAIVRAVDLPVIGIAKRRVNGYPIYITPSGEDAAGLARAGSAMIAVDGTSGRRPPDSSGRSWTLSELVTYIHDELGLPAMADVSVLDEGLRAEDLGFDCVATTLSGYTPYSPALDEPDFGLVGALAARISVPVIAEGRITVPEEVSRALALGAWAVVVGRAITMPHTIVKRFVAATSRKEVSK
jgi:N-acylglucosamine-6-phosphate 2-epimerase